MEKSEIERIFEMVENQKKEEFVPKPVCAGLLFERPSTRTRVSFEVALHQLGMHPISLEYVFSQLARGESIEDTGKVMSGYVSVIIARLRNHEMLQRLASSSAVPVINAATELEHPCQALGDLYTIRQEGLLREGTNIAYIGKPDSNVANALAAAAAKFGIEVTFIAPKGYPPNKAYAKNAKLTNDFNVRADIAYANAFDVDEEELKKFLPYQLNEEKMNALGARFSMHPLPAYRGFEISDGVLDARSSLAWKQAENKVAVQKAIIKYVLG